ncbi:hypothetical protein KGF54_003160 [Candida jiufengensis]|uniref:uncharacterized protein n=1 Tax=Candida jiufengensis TaxID=497108 RepID=UPI0022253DD1|nr:uncharacterized protein KGF54_003160 [Candida jiufengensis]KAI5952294.1 hypothetical protein KGF54_003160 [Candida jiufengensis]
MDASDFDIRFNCGAYTYTSDQFNQSTLESIYACGQNFIRLKNSGESQYKVANKFGLIVSVFALSMMFVQL